MDDTNEVENRDYTEGEIAFGGISETPMFGSLTAPVAEAEQELKRKKDLIDRDNLSSAFKTDVFGLGALKPNEEEKKNFDEINNEEQIARSQVEKNSNWFFKWLDERERDSRFELADNSGEQVEVNDTLGASILNNHQLPRDYLYIIKGAKTNKGLEERLDWATKDNEANGYISKALTNKQILFESIKSGIQTPDMVLGVAVTGGAYAGAKLLTGVASKLATSTKFIAGVEFGTEAGINLFHEQVDEDYRMRDAVSDTFIYGSIGTGMTRFVTPNTIKDVTDSSLYTKQITISQAYKDEAYNVIRGSKGIKISKKIDDATTIDKDGMVIIQGEEREQPFEVPRTVNGVVERNRTYIEPVKPDGDIVGATKSNEPSPDKAQTLKQQGEVRTKIDNTIDEAVDPEINRAVDNLEQKRIKLQEARKEIVTPKKERLKKLSNDIKSKYETLKETGISLSKSTRIKKQIAKLEKHLSAVKEEIRKIDLGHNKSMKELGNKIKDIKASAKESPARKEVDERFAYYADEPVQYMQDIMNLVKSNPDKEYLEAVKTHIEKVRDKFPDEVNNLEKLIKSKTGNVPADTSRWHQKLSKSSKTIATLSTILSASVASASDDDELTGTQIVLITGLVMLGIANRELIASIFTSGSGVGGKVENLTKSLKKAITGIIYEEGMNNASRARKSATALIEKGYSQLFSTSAPFIKKGGVAMEFIKKLLYNKDFGAGALTMKNEWFKSTMADYKVAEKDNFRIWLDEQGIVENKILNNTNDMVRFRETILDVKEGIVKSDSKAINNMVKLLNDKFDDMLQANKDYKTHGFEKIQFNKNYVPRLWRSKLIQDVLNTLTDNQVQSFIDALAKSIKYKDAEEVARKLVNNWMNDAGNASAKTKQEVVGMLSDANLLKEGEDIDDILDAITGVSDRQSRAKYRIDIDMSTLKEEVDKLNIDNLGFRDILDRNSESVLDKLGNQLYGTAALSREDITSIVKLDSMIADVAKQDAELGAKAIKIKDLVLGIPLDTDDVFLQGISGALKDITLGGKLQLVVLSTPTEISQTIFSNGFFTGIKNIVTAIKVKHGRESHMLNELAKIGSLGRSTDSIDLKYAHRGFSNEFVENGETAFSRFREGTMKFRDLIIYMSGLAGMTDILQIANKFSHTEQLAKMANNMEHSIPMERFMEFGITEERIASLKPYLKYENGVLTKVDINKMPRKVRDDYQEMLFNMNQAITPETTVGETPLFSKTSSLGRILTTLVAYPMQQFNLHGIQGIKRMDKYTAIQMISGVGGTYLGLSARNEILGRDMDDDDLLKYSFMNMPQGLGLSAAISFADPAVFSHTQDIANIADFTD